MHRAQEWGRGTERVEDGVVVQTGVRMKGCVIKMLDNLVLMLAGDFSENINTESGVATSRLRSILQYLD